MKLFENGDQFLLNFLSKMKRTLALNKFDYDYMVSFHYKVSGQKLCSTFILIDSNILRDLCSLSHSKY